MDKKKVYEAYEEIVNWFDEARSKSLMEMEYLNFIVNTIPAGGSILDLGCGTGVPIAQFFIEKGYRVTGVDGSHKMIERCKQRFPNEHWIVADMRDINLQQRFDAIIAWHSFFHLDPDSQRFMFNIFASHLNLGGLLVFTSNDEAGEIWSDNGGQMLYHSSLSTHEYKNLLHATSFEILIHKIRDPACGDATVWVAQYR